MCLRPIYITSKSVKLSLNGSRAKMKVPCGKCAECRANKRDEWTIRCYCEYIRALDNGGYTLFQTLTYAPEKCPSFDGIRCFNPQHIREFREALRYRIHPYGANKDNFKIIIVSEYGGINHQPHYHLLAFSRCENLDPFILDSAIKDSWPYGITDGMLPKSKPLHDRIANSISVLSYCSKYICKSDSFIDVLEAKMLEDKVLLPNDAFKKKYSKENMRKIFGFMRVSNSFGMDVLDGDRLGMLTNYSDAFESGKIIIPDKNDIAREIKIPQSIMRRYFYRLADDPNLLINGKPAKYWTLNDEGIKFRDKQLHKSISKFAENCEQIQRNITTVMPDKDNNGDYVYLNKLLQLLNGRSWIDYAIYKLCYQGYLYDPTKDLPDMYTMVGDSYLSRYNADIRVINRHDVFGPKVTSKKYILPDNIRHKMSSYLNLPDQFEIDDQKLSRFIIQEDTDIRFIYFDKIDQILEEYTDRINRAKILEYKKIQEDKARHKLETEPWLRYYHYQNENKVSFFGQAIHDLGNVSAHKKAMRIYDEVTSHLERGLVPPCAGDTDEFTTKYLKDVMKVDLSNVKTNIPIRLNVSVSVFNKKW